MINGNASNAPTTRGEPANAVSWASGGVHRPIPGYAAASARCCADNRETAAGVATATTSTRYPASANREAVPVTISGSRNVPSNNTENLCVNA